MSEVYNVLRDESKRPFTFMHSVARTKKKKHSGELLDNQTWHTNKRHATTTTSKVLKFPTTLWLMKRQFSILSAKFDCPVMYAINFHFWLLRIVKLTYGAVFHSVCQVWLSSGPPEFLTFSYYPWLWNWLVEQSSILSAKLDFPVVC